MTRSIVRWVAVFAAGTTLAGLALGAQAAKVYKWTDSSGITHYGDRAPDAASAAVKSGTLKVIPVAVEARAVARLRLETNAGRYLAYADNNLAGPIEVMLQARSGGFDSEPGLPTRAVVPPNGSLLVAVKV